MKDHQLGIQSGGLVDKHFNLWIKRPLYYPYESVVCAFYYESVLCTYATYIRVSLCKLTCIPLWVFFTYSEHRKKIHSYLLTRTGYKRTRIDINKHSYYEE